MSVIEERNAEIFRPQLKLIAQGRSRVLDVPPEAGNRDRVSIMTTTYATQAEPLLGQAISQVGVSQKFVSESWSIATTAVRASGIGVIGICCAIARLASDCPDHCHTSAPGMASCN